MTGFYKKRNTGLKWLKLTFFRCYYWADYINFEGDQKWTKPFFCARVYNTSWNIISLLSDYTPQVSFYTHWKGQKARGFSYLEGVYRETSVMKRADMLS